ncbi:hypothetical protein BT69DRAFT_1275428, partial [Atractiella rhizophila]
SPFIWTALVSPLPLVNQLGANILIGDIENVRRCTLADIYAKRRIWVGTHMWGSKATAVRTTEPQSSPPKGPGLGFKGFNLQSLSVASSPSPPLTSHPRRLSVDMKSPCSLRVRGGEVWIFEWGLAWGMEVWKWRNERLRDRIGNGNTNS